MLFWAVYSFVVLQRLIELYIAKRNGQRLLALGAYEVGAWQHKWFVLLHTSFLLALLVEVSLRTDPLPVLGPYLLIVFATAQIGRYWVLRTLGVRWNTRIYVLPGAPLIRSGPYRWLKHPNYVIVTIELLVLPLAFGAFWTALAASAANLLLLRLRIPLEERALSLRD